MSLYNMLFGFNKLAAKLLTILELDAEFIPRFRDCFIDTGNKKIIVYTRTGGANRSYYDSLQSHIEACECKDGDECRNGSFNNYLKDNKYFSHDEDDDYDSTYTNFFFNFPDEYKETLEDFCTHNYEPKASERFKELFKEKI